MTTSCLIQKIHINYVGQEVHQNVLLLPNIISATLSYQINSAHSSAG